MQNRRASMMFVEALRFCIVKSERASKKIFFELCVGGVSCGQCSFTFYHTESFQVSDYSKTN